MSKAPTCAQGPGAAAACGSGHRGPTDPSVTSCLCLLPSAALPQGLVTEQQGVCEPLCPPRGPGRPCAPPPDPIPHSCLLPSVITVVTGILPSVPLKAGLSLREGVLWIPLIYSIMGTLFNSSPGQAGPWVYHGPSMSQGGVASPVWSGTWRAPWTELSVLNQPCVPGQQATCQLSLCRGRSVSVFRQPPEAAGRAVSEAARPLEVRRAAALFPGSTRVGGWNYFSLQSWVETAWGRLLSLETCRRPRLGRGESEDVPAVPPGLRRLLRPAAFTIAVSGGRRGPSFSITRSWMAAGGLAFQRTRS